MNLELFVDLLKWALAPICTLLAGYIGIRYGLKQVRTQKKLDFIERQLREFYSPILGCQKEIRAKSELRLEISEAAKKAWKEVCESAPKPFLNHDKEFEPYEKMIEYDNEQLKNELLPLYRKMLLTFRENYGLADPETDKWYSELCNFVELWERWISDNIPAEVIKKLDYSEKRLNPFYRELENRIDILRSKLSR